jgi:hypothetical protein
MDKLYRFSPIKNKKELFEAIKYTHFASFELCKKALGKYLTVAGNIAIFCHYKEEFELLTKLRKELADISVSFNGKYFRLYKPIVVAAKDDILETTYEYLYIRQPDRFRAQVGDVDFVIDKNEYKKIQDSKVVNNVEIFNRPDLSMCELFNPDFDVLAYLTTKKVAEAIAN